MGKVALICLNGVTSFFWLGIHQYPASRWNESTFFSKLSTIITRINSESYISFIITRQLLFRNQQSAFLLLKNADQLDIMGRQWFDMITLRFVITKTNIRGVVSVIVSVKQSSTSFYMLISDYVDLVLESQSDGLAA